MLFDQLQLDFDTWEYLNVMFDYLNVIFDYLNVMSNYLNVISDYFGCYDQKIFLIIRHNIQIIRQKKFESNYCECYI